MSSGRLNNYQRVLIHPFTTKKYHLINQTESNFKIKFRIHAPSNNPNTLELNITHGTHTNEEKGGLLVFVLHELGSMRNYTKSVKEFISNMIEGNIDLSIKHIVTVIAFSATVDHAPAISKLKLHSNHFRSPDLPFVLPVSTPADLPREFGHQEGLMLTELKQNTIIPDQITADTVLCDLILFAHLKYNTFVGITGQNA